MFLRRRGVIECRWVDEKETVLGVPALNDFHRIPAFKIHILQPVHQVLFQAVFFPVETQNGFVICPAEFVSAADSRSKRQIAHDP